MEIPFEDNAINNYVLFSEIHVTEQDVEDQIKILDTNKSYGPDGISPIFLKEGGLYIIQSLAALFNLSLRMTKFPMLWKQANVVPIHKKEDKSDANNYRPISLLSTVGKVFERIVFKYVFNYLRDNYIINLHQSGFLPGKSTVTQLIEVYHQFCKAVDNNKEIRVIFLDISKAFDKVWHRGLLHKLKRCGIGDRILLWFQNYLQSRQQRVIINGQTSNWGDIQAGVPQGSVLGPLLFLIFINDLPQVVDHCSIRLFADDTCLFIEVNERIDTAVKINHDLNQIAEWSKKWLVSFSPTKTKSLLISNKVDSWQNPPVMFNGVQIKEVMHHTYLGLIFSNNLKWSRHIDKIATTAQKRLNMMLPLKLKVDRKSLEVMYKSFVLPTMEYAIVVWGGAHDSDICKLERIHVDGMRLITGATARSNIAKLFIDTGFSQIKHHYEQSTLVMIYKVKHNLAPNYLKDLLPPRNCDYVNYNLRNNQDIKVPYTRLETFRRSFIPSAIKLWNTLSIEYRSCPSVTDFKKLLKTLDEETNVLYYYGQRWTAVHHTRMRLGCSKLNYDLCFNLHVSNDPSCICGAQFETARHYFVECQLYTRQRETLKATIERVGNFNINTMLFGDKTLTVDENIAIFGAVHAYIVDSNRFV